MARSLTDEQARHVHDQMRGVIAYLFRLEQALVRQGHDADRHPYLRECRAGLNAARALSYMSLCIGRNIGLHAPGGTAGTWFGAVDCDGGFIDGDGI